MVYEEKLICSVTCYPRPSYIAGRLANAMCLGSVCTHPVYRRRGLLRQVLAEAAEWMKSQGVLWSFLYGSQAVYGSSGWKHLTTRSLSVDIPVKEELGTQLTARPAGPERDLPALMAIYEQFSGQLTGPIVRDESSWNGRISRHGEHGYMLIEQDGLPIGYFVGSDGTVAELGWTGCPQETLAFLLRQWPAQPVSLPLCSSGILEVLRDIAAIPDQSAHHEHPATITVEDTSSGLWQYHQDREGLFPEFADTEGLLRFLHEHDYVMWRVDQM